MAAYLDRLQMDGRFTFSTSDAVHALRKSVPAVRAALRRLQERGLVVQPHRGFHVIVPPPYRRLGCLPAEQFIPDLMTHLGEPYYVGLLSAAAYHGASHHAPMVFQVVVPKSRRGFECGGVRVEFVARRDMETTSIVERNTATGILRIASPAATAFELVGYPERAGYLDNVATILSELAETIDHPSLEKEALRAPTAWIQRLGYLLSLVEQDALAASLANVLQERKPFTVPLAPWLDMVGATRDPRWNVAINTMVEADV